MLHILHSHLSANNSPKRQFGNHKGFIVHRDTAGDYAQPPHVLIPRNIQWEQRVTDAMVTRTLPPMGDRDGECPRANFELATNRQNLRDSTEDETGLAN